MNDRLGGHHSAKIILKSIDYHDIYSAYGKDHDKIAFLLSAELSHLISLNPDCIVICCNSLHKYYDIIKASLDNVPPVFHAVELVAKDAIKNNYNKVLLLATKFTMEDGFFSDTLINKGLEVIVPSPEERVEMQVIHGQLMQNMVTAEAKNYFGNLIAKYGDVDAVVLGCTEYPLVVDSANCVLPILDTVKLQAEYAVDYALSNIA